MVCGTNSETENHDLLAVSVKAQNDGLTNVPS